MTIFKPVLDFNHQQLALCLTIVSEQAKLLKKIRKAVSHEIGDAIKHSVVSGQKLIIYVESSAWASQIRFIEADIIKAASDFGFTKIKTIQIKIQAEYRPLKPPSAIKLPSANTIRLIQQQSQQKTDDAVSQALSRLGDTLEKRLTTKS